MRKFIFLIGSMDDFESLEDLKNTYFNGGPYRRNMSVFEVEIAGDTGILPGDPLAIRAMLLNLLETSLDACRMDKDKDGSSGDANNEHCRARHFIRGVVAGA